MNTARSTMLLLASFGTVAWLVTASPSLAGGEINLLVGDKSFAAVGDKQPAGLSIALLTSFRSRNWPVWAACDVSANYGTNYWTTQPEGSVGLDIFTLDIHPGLRKVWESRRWRSSVGAGPAFHLVLPSISSGWTILDWRYEAGGGSAVGFWLNGRTAVRFGAFQMGLDARLSRARSTIDLEAHQLIGHVQVASWPSRELDLESGGQSLGFFIGLGW